MKNYCVISFATDFLDSQQKLKHISFQAHDVGLEYTKNLRLDIKGLDAINIRITNWEEESISIIDYKVGSDKLGVVLSYQNIEKLVAVTSLMDRQLLLLDLLHSIMIKQVVHYNWNIDSFEEAFYKTKERIQKGEPLPSFLKFMMGG